MRATALAQRGKTSGFTLVELLVTAVLLSILAWVAMPMVELTLQRAKEEELRRSLIEIRDALDAYRKAYEAGHMPRVLGASGYPPSLEVLVEGVPDARSPNGARMRFLRRIPRDPFHPDTKMPAADTWGKRSYESSAEEPEEGKDVFDVYSLSLDTGLNGIPYRDW